jgi:hypothetical protein
VDLPRQTEANPRDPKEGAARPLQGPHDQGCGPTREDPHAQRCGTTPEKIRTFKDAARARKDPCSRSKVATERLRGLSSRLSGLIAYWGSANGARCPRRVQGAPAPFQREQKKTFSRYSPNMSHSVLISHGTQHLSNARLRSRSVHAGRASQRNTGAPARKARRPRCHRRSRAFPYPQSRCPRRSRRCAAAAEPGGPCRWCFAFVAD